MSLMTFTKLTFSTPLYVALLTVASLILAFQTQAYLEWQPPQLTNGQDNLKTRFWAKPKQPDTVPTSRKQIQLTSSSPYQRFVVCADSVASDTPAFITPFEENWKQAHYHELLTMEPSTRLELLLPKACNVDEDSYPYHFLGLLHSDKPFLAVEGKPTGQKQKKTTNNGLMPSPPHTSGTVIPIGGGYGADDDDLQRKRPPWLPFQSSGAYSLMVLPALKLPEQLQGYLPDNRLYYELLDQLGYGGEITIILRVQGHKPASISITRYERSELAEKMTSATKLLDWLAPKLNGREDLVVWLLDLQTHFSGNDTEAETEFLEAVEKQLAIVLEQNDNEFIFDFEKRTLINNTQLLDGLSPNTAPATPDQISHNSKVNQWIKKCPIGKYPQQNQASQCLGLGDQSSGAQSHSSTSAGSDNLGGDANKHQVINNDEERTGDRNAVSTSTPEVTITFVGNNNTGKSTLANLLLGFTHFGKGSRSTEGLEQDYLHEGVRIRALPGYSRSLPSRYAQKYDIGSEDIIIFVMEDEFSADDIRLLKDIVNKRGHNQDRLIIVRNKYDTLRVPAIREAERSSISFHESLLLTRDRIQVDIRRKLREVNLNDRIPILFTSADEQSWMDVKELYGSVNTILGGTNESWNRFSIAFDTIERIHNEITEHRRDSSTSLAENITRAFRRFIFSAETQHKIAGILRRGLEKEENQKLWDFKELDIDLIIAGTVTMVTLPPDLNSYLVAKIQDKWRKIRLHYGSPPGNTRKLLTMGADLTVGMNSDTLYITLGKKIVARIIPPQNHATVYQSGILGQRSPITLSNLVRSYFLRETANPGRYLRKISDLVAGKMAYLKFIEVRNELSQRHSCPGEKCPPPLKEFPPEPWFRLDCSLQ